MARASPYPTARPWLPPEGGLLALAEAARGCQGCPLWERGTQTVFGSGPAHAPIVLVGEQPGDEEDRAGLPFVGPAGRLLDRALERAGIPRASAYVTNAVKHFKWVARGKRRIHQKPDPGEILACRPWLEAELEALRPSVIVALGATAAAALFGAAVRVTRDRGRPLASPLAPLALVTVHPSAVLRAPDDAARRAGFEALAADLRVAREGLRQAEPGAQPW
ncbi:MAG: UdgX family uracil-DNA binding protein [Anaeromyxobacteraceae bacterium]